MCPFETKTSFEQANGLGEIAFPLIIFEEFVELLCMDDNIETADLGETELFFLQASTMNLFPDPGGCLVM